MCNIFNPHQWSKWKMEEKKNILKDERLFGFFSLQSRECQKCNLKEYKKDQITIY